MFVYWSKWSLMEGRRHGFQHNQWSVGTSELVSSGLNESWNIVEFGDACKSWNVQVSSRVTEDWNVIVVSNTASGILESPSM